MFPRVCGALLPRGHGPLERIVRQRAICAGCNWLLVVIPNWAPCFGFNLANLLSCNEKENTNFIERQRMGIILRTGSQRGDICVGHGGPKLLDTL